jgi:GMP synthase-like glutamine amidotransferase
MQSSRSPIRVAILDLYHDYPNQGMRGFQDILNQFKAKYNLDLTYQIFDVRGKVELPGTEFDLYISSGGPGSPIESVNDEWDVRYFQLINAIEAHNNSDNPQKKHVLFVCHSFQLMCRYHQLGQVNKRRKESFGIFPVHLTGAGKLDAVMKGLEDTFFAVDSREWQVIEPDWLRFQEIGAELVALEKERPHVDLPRAMMAIRFNEYFFGTQFHPEADPIGMRMHMLKEDKKQTIVEEYGQHKYDEMMDTLEHPEKIVHTYHTIIPNFLYQAINSLQEA